MADVTAILSSDEYKGLPEAERAKVVERLTANVPELHGLPDAEKASFMNRAVQMKKPVPTTATGEPLPDHPHTPTPQAVQPRTLDQWNQMTPEQQKAVPAELMNPLKREELLSKMGDFSGVDYMGKRDSKVIDAEHGKMVKDLWKEFTTAHDPRQLKVGGVVRETVSGAVAGTALAVATPKLFNLLGSALVKGPGPAKVAGVAMLAAGKGLSMIPVRERILLGAGGGAGMGASEEVADSMGASPAIKAGIGVIGSGVGEVASSFLMKQMKSMLKIAGFATYGSGHGVALAASEMLRPNEALNREIARNLQTHLFGEQIPGKIAGVFSINNREANTLLARKINPDIPAGIQASTYYREKYFDEINSLIAPEAKASVSPVKGVLTSMPVRKLFSSSNEFKTFTETLQTKVSLGQITKADADHLIGAVSADRLRKSAVQSRYAENLDNQIRFWAKSAEKDGVSGANAASQKIDMEVRSDLQKAVNGFLKSNGKAANEEKYRAAAKAEYTAEAKDKIPYLVSHYGKEGDMKELVRNLSKDPETHQIFVKEVQAHLTSLPPETVASEFKRLDEMLVRSGMFDINNPAQMQMLQQLRVQAAAIQKTADKGEQIALADRFKRTIGSYLGRQLGVSASQQTAPSNGEGQ